MNHNLTYYVMNAELYFSLKVLYSIISYVLSTEAAQRNIYIEKHLGHK